MFVNIVIGSLLMIANLGIQVIVFSLLIRYFIRRLESSTGDGYPTVSTDGWILSVVMAFLLLGHLFQFATWALLFVSLGEFQDFATAFYHSTVNFTSLGYGDIVMSEGRRLLGALEAANGVLMFGLSAGIILSVMNQLFSRHKAVVKIRKSLGPKD